MLRSRIFWKLFAAYAIVVALTTAGLSSLIVHRVERSLLEETHRLLRSEALLLRDVARQYVTGEADSAFQNRINTLGSRTSMRFTVIRADGIVVADSREDPAAMDNHRSRPEVLEALARGVGSATRYSRTLEQEMMYVAIPIEGNGNVVGFVRASEPVTHVDERIGEIRRLTFLGGSLSILLALIVGLILARGFSHPLIEMTTAAGAIASGDYARQIDVHRSDEIGKLAAALDKMTYRLREHISTITADRNQTLAIFSGMVEGVIAVDREEKIVLINRAAERILAVDTPAVGRRIWEVSRLREVSDATADAMTREQLSIAEARIPGPDKDQVIQLIATPLKNDDGVLAGAIVVLHDISELRQLEKVRRDFIANISHELKTPLAAIRGLVETLIDDKEMEGDTHDRFLDKIRAQSNRLSNLVTDLLTISRLESDDAEAQLELVDFREPVAESYRNLSSVADAQQVTIETTVPDHPVDIRGDRESLRGLVDNLLDNAIKYSAVGGTVALRLDVREGNAVLEVEDSGIGISQEDQGRIFERFYRVDKARSRQLGGTGLGLSIVKHVTLAHGGNVSLRSAPNKGSTFSIQIPLTGSRASARS